MEDLEKAVNNMLWDNCMDEVDDILKLSRAIINEPYNYTVKDKAQELTALASNVKKSLLELRKEGAN